MNQMKIPNMVTSFEMDKSFQQQMFIQNQSELNDFIKKNHKNNNYHNKTEDIIAMSSANLSDRSRVKFNENGVDSRIQGKMLQDQMRLKVLQSEYDHQKAKIEDEHNAKTFNKKYPYGKQNVKITEQVIDKYSMNTYLNQSQMLKKFQQDAKKRKQQNNNRRRGKQVSSWSAQKQYIPLPNNYNSARSAKKRTSILTQQMNKLYEAKKKYLVEGNVFLTNLAQKTQRLQKAEKKLHKREYSREKENKKLDNIESMLKQVRSKLDLNIGTLNEKQNQRLKHINFQKWVQISKDRMEKLSQLAKQQDFYRRKVPVVIYNNDKNSEKNYFSRIVCPDIDSYQRKENIDKPEEFNQVINIYHLNKKRMDQLSEKIAVQENKSIF